MLEQRRFMRIITPAICSGLLFSMTSALAQTTPPTAPTPPTPGANAGRPGHGVGARLQRMAQALNLTPDQQTKIRAIMVAQRNQVQQTRANTTLTAAQQKTQIASIHKGSMKQIHALLTPAQLTKLKAMQRAQKNGTTAATTPTAPAAPNP